MSMKNWPCLLADYFSHAHTVAPRSLVQKVDTVLLRAHGWPASAMAGCRRGRRCRCSALSKEVRKSHCLLDSVIWKSRCQKAKFVKPTLPTQEVGMIPRIKGTTVKVYSGVSRVLQCPNALDFCLPCSMRTLA